MAEEREQKVKNIRDRLEQMKVREESVKASLDELTIETEKMEKEIRNKLREQLK